MLQMLYVRIYFHWLFAVSLATRAADKQPTQNRWGLTTCDRCRNVLVADRCAISVRCFPKERDFPRPLCFMHGFIWCGFRMTEYGRSLAERKCEVGVLRKTTTTERMAVLPPWFNSFTRSYLCIMNALQLKNTWSNFLMLSAISRRHEWFKAIRLVEWIPDGHCRTGEISVEFFLAMTF